MRIAKLAPGDVPKLDDEKLAEAHARCHEMWAAAENRGEADEFPWHALHQATASELVARGRSHAVEDGLDKHAALELSVKVVQITREGRRGHDGVSLPGLEDAYDAALADGATQAEERGGVMLALYPSPELAQALALNVEGAEQPESLHITIVFVGFLGEDVPADAAGLLAASAEAAAARVAPVEGWVQGPARFGMPPGAEEERDTFVATFDSYDVAVLRRAVEDELRVRGIPFRVEHGFSPHATLLYSEKGADWPIDRIEPVEARFDALTLVVAGERTDYPLTGPNPGMPVVAALAGDNPAGVGREEGGMFERFTDRARCVVILAQEEARSMEHSHIGTEHLFLALIHEGEGVAAQALSSLGYALDDTRSKIPRGTSKTSGHIPFTPRAKRVLELALREALQLGHNYVGTEHILLGLARDGTELAGGMAQFAAQAGKIRRTVIEILSGYQTQTAPQTQEVVMPWHVAEGEGCSADEPWAVVNTETGERVACHATEEAAQAQVRALYANIDEGEEQIVDLLAEVQLPGGTTPPDGGLNDPPDTIMALRFHGVLLPEGVRTMDGRRFREGSLTIRELTLPLMHQYEKPDGEHPHGKARLVGKIDTLQRQSNGEWHYAGEWDTSPEALEAARLVDKQMLRWISADVDVDDYEELMEGDCSEEGAAAGDCKSTFEVTRGRIAGGTLVPIPAFPEAVIASESMTIPDATENGRAAATNALAAAAAEEGASPALVAAVYAFVAAAPSIPVDPPAEWFDSPEFGAGGEDARLVYDHTNHQWGSPLTIADDGRVFGHGALWKTCYVGPLSGCMLPPRSLTGYAHYRVGAVKCPDGCEIPTGALTMGGKHASLEMGSRAAQAFYDETSAAVADLACGEDEHGVWIAGALRPGVTGEQLRSIRASTPSGDWRRIGGNLELINFHLVNVPGFPVPRAVAASAADEAPFVRIRYESDVAVSLVAAAGIMRPDPAAARLRELEQRVAVLERVARPVAAKRLHEALERATATA